MLSRDKFCFKILHCSIVMAINISKYISKIFKGCILDLVECCVLAIFFYFSSIYTEETRTKLLFLFQLVLEAGRKHTQETLRKKLLFIYSPWSIW